MALSIFFNNNYLIDSMEVKENNMSKNWSHTDIDGR